MLKAPSIKIFKYKIPFVKPLKIFSNEFSYREGFILKVADQENNFRLSEIAPIHSISYENLNDSYLQLTDACINLKKNKEIDLNSMYPSVFFGIFSIIKYFPIKSFSIPYSGLLYSNFNLDNFKPILSTYKLKLSNLSVDEACFLVKKIKKKLPKIKLRLDINQSWSYAESFNFLNNFSPNDFEYIEDPCKSIDETKRILKTTNHNIAIDESLSGWSINDLLRYKNIKALIIKPMLVNFHKYLKCQIPIVFSSLFETGVGLTAIAKLSQAYSKKTPGLDTYKFLKYDVLKNPIVFNEKMRVIHPNNINSYQLKQCFAV